MGDEKETKLFEMLFLQMVMSLNEAAMIQMGKMVNPTSGKTEKNVSQAQGTIDLLRMLKMKTHENLNEQEQQLLDQSIMNLEMNFVNEKSSDKPATQEKEPPQTPPSGLVLETDTEAEAKDDDDTNDSLGNRPGMNN